MLPTHRRPTAPGKILLEEFLIPLGLSQSEFATRLSAVITGKIAITESIALELSEVLGTSPEFWLGLQADFEMSLFI
jgi:antitoxin HigA-1